MSATTCAAVVSWPWPCGVVPSVTTISPKMSSLTVATSLLPENCSSGLIIRDWPKLFVPESSVEPMPTPSSLPRAFASARRCLDRSVVDELERDVEHARVVARVVDAAVRRLVRHVLGPDVVALAHLDRVDAELVRDDVDHALGEPEVLHARVAAVRRARRLVRRDLREVDADVPPLVHAGRDLRPDDAAERLVAQPGAGVVERLRPEAEQRAVVLDRDLGLVEPALVAVRHRHVEVGAPLRPLHGAVRACARAGSTRRAAGAR